MEKEWRDIDGYEKYQCSDYGDVRNKLTGKVLSQSFGTNGYLKVSLCKCGIAKTHYVHRLVSETFIGNSGEKMQVNHKNCDKTDNAVTNLEYTTPKGNTQHAIENGLFSTSGESNGRSKLTARDIPNIRRDLASGEYSQDEIAEKYGVKKNAISMIKLGITWKSIPDESGLEACTRTKKKALEIRRLLDEGELSQAEISREVGVSGATVSNIKKGKRWGNI